ncbi:hypothetical protein [Yinghuangia sp. YIM S09857]|uniref:hypothetical protein n=1 Tax=Yinghuangia sp. YIM S09857 TaxID=3436929 RepID=UPI003F52EFB5
MIDDDGEFPVARAELVAETAVPVVDPVGRWSGGGWIASGVDGGVFVVDRNLQVVERFAVPDELPWPSRDDLLAPSRYRVDVSPDARWAVFTGFDRTIVVDPAGRVAWRNEHPAFRDEDGDEVPAAAVFRPDGGALWGYARPTDPTLATTDGEPAAVVRHVVNTGDWRPTATVASIYQGLLANDPLVHPGGSIVGFNNDDGCWVHCDDHSETVLRTGSWYPLGFSPDGMRWVGATDSVPVVGDVDGDFHGALTESDFAPFPLREDEDEDDEEEIDAAYFVTSRLVAVFGARSLNPHHVLTDATTLEPVARLDYGGNENGDLDSLVGSDGDGTWVTSTVGLDSSWRVRPGRLRRWTAALS